MVQKLLVLGVRHAVAFALVLLSLSVVGSSPAFCPKCPATSDFLNKTKWQIMWMKRSVRELYVSYATHMDLLNARHVCESTPVPWFPSKNVTRKPERLMLLDLYRTFVNLEDSLAVLKEQQRFNNPEGPLNKELGEASFSVAGVLSNIRCALCLQDLAPTRAVPSERTLAGSDFYRKVEGCRILWSYSKFIRRLAKIFRKQFARRKSPRRQKNKKERSR